MQLTIIIDTDHPDASLVVEQAGRWVAEELDPGSGRWPVRIAVTEDGLETSGYVLDGDQ